MRAGSIRRFSSLPRWIRPGSGDAQMVCDVEALLASAQAAVSAAAAGLPSAADLRAEAARAEALAASGAGAVAKTAAGVGGSLRRQWLRWLDEHGEAYGYDDTEGPTVEHVLHFQTHGFTSRKNYSTVQLDGLGDSWGELAVPYLLAKFVFTELEYPGWVGLTAEELAAKCKPYTLEARTHWKRLKVSHVRGGVDNGRSLAKDKWDDGLLYLAQDECMREKLRLNRAVTRLAIFGFVRITCSRSGAFGRDWFDRAGLQLQWAGPPVEKGGLGRATAEG